MSSSWKRHRSNLEVPSHANCVELLTVCHDKPKLWHLRPFQGDMILLTGPPTWAATNLCSKSIINHHPSFRPQNNRYDRRSTMNLPINQTTGPSTENPAARHPPHRILQCLAAGRLLSGLKLYIYYGDLHTIIMIVDRNEISCPDWSNSGELKAHPVTDAASRNNEYIKTALKRVDSFRFARSLVTSPEDFSRHLTIRHDTLRSCLIHRHLLYATI